jgi:ABC-type glycerol-3-phosphate transport system substrate-binding protein
LQMRRRTRCRVAAGLITLVALLCAACSSAPSAPQKVGGNTVVTMWSWLSASDAQVWSQVIGEFNKANDNKGLHEQINLVQVSNTDYTTKITAAVAAGDAPDFGWSFGGFEDYNLVKNGVIIGMSKLAKEVGLNLSDFTPLSLAGARYPSVGGNDIYMIPTDLSDFALEINVKDAEAAGLDPSKPPTNGAEFLKWMQAMTITKNGRVVQGGLGINLANVAATYFGIVAAQYGFQRVSSNGKQACVNRQGASVAMQWLLNLFNKYKVVSVTSTSIYQSFDSNQSAMIMEGPWSIHGNIVAGLNWEAAAIPQIGPKPANYFEDDGLQMYKQPNDSRYKATMEAIKWISDNDSLWTQGGRGASPRMSIEAEPGYATSDVNGFLPKYREAFVNGLKDANVASIPGPDVADFEYYEISPSFTQTEVGLVLTGKLSVPNFVTAICQKYQSDIDSGGVTE